MSFGTKLVSTDTHLLDLIWDLQIIYRNMFYIATVQNRHKAICGEGNNGTVPIRKLDTHGLASMRDHILRSYQPPKSNRSCKLLNLRTNRATKGSKLPAD